MKTPRGIRNRNPGNVEYNPGTPWQGLDTPPSDGRFCVFKTPFYGLRCLCKVMLTYQRIHGRNTVRDLINRWAPPKENDTSAYVRSVAKRLGVQPDEKIDLGSAALLAKLADAIVWHENGQNPYAPDLILQAAESALR